MISKIGLSHIPSISFKKLEKIEGYDDVKINKQFGENISTAEKAILENQKNLDNNIRQCTADIIASIYCIASMKVEGSDNSEYLQKIKSLYYKNI